MKTTPCRYCQIPTNRVYIDKRVKSIASRRLVSACKSCASEIPYLSITLIFTEPTYEPLPEPIKKPNHQETREAVDQNLMEEIA